MNLGNACLESEGILQNKINHYYELQQLDTFRVDFLHNVYVLPVKYRSTTKDNRHIHILRSFIYRQD